MLSDVRIMVVEDDPDLRELTVDYFQSLGAEVSSATNGQCALEKINEDSQKLDVIISDVRMPYLNGLDFLKRAKRVLDPFPVFIFVTGYADVTEEQVKRLGATTVVSKPTDWNKVLQLITNRLSRP